MCSVGDKTGSSTASDERTAEYSGSVTQNQVSRSTAYSARVMILEVLEL